MAAKRPLPEADEQAIRYMLRFASDAVRPARHAGRREYDSRLELRLALERLVELTGEAAKRVSTETRTLLAQIEWSNLIRMRDRLAHYYDSTDPEIVWNTVRKELPLFVRQLQAVLGGRYR
jgi:uncharacterized protein with HEPN domain